MSTMLYRAAFIAAAGVFLAIIGFNGVRQEIEVSYGKCRQVYSRYYVEPFLPEVICPLTRFRPCVNFALLRVHNAHAEMFDCLCREPEENRHNLVDYQDYHYRPVHRTVDHVQICRNRPKPEFPKWEPADPLGRQPSSEMGDGFWDMIQSFLKKK